MFRKRLILLSVIVLLPGCFGGLFFHPDRIEYDHPELARLKYEDIFFKSPDGTKLHAWFIHAGGKSKGTVVHFHGNAQNITAHFSLVRWLPDEGYDLFMFDYRGYGKSEGKADREGLFQDSVAALKYVLSRKDVDKKRLFVIGQSLGGANAIVAVASLPPHTVKGVVIESAFASYQDIALEKAIVILGGTIGSAPSLLTDDRLSPNAFVSRISPTPILFIHGTKDRVVPITHSQKLLKLAGEPRDLLVIPNGRHLEAFRTYLPHTKPVVLDFFERAKMAGSE